MSINFKTTQQQKVTSGEFELTTNALWSQFSYDLTVIGEPFLCQWYYLSSIWLKINSYYV